MRKIIFNAHLIAAFGTSAILVVLSLTGCLLIFEKRIDAWVDPGLSRANPQGGTLPISAIAEKAAAAAGGKRITEIHLAGPNRPMMAVTSNESRIYVNSHTGEVIGRRAGPLPSLLLRRLHKNLLAGTIGGRIVAGTTILLIFQSCSGLFLWWPLKRVSVRFGASSRRIAFDIHHAAGSISSAFICIVCVTGLIRYYPQITERLFEHPAPNPVAAPHESAPSTPGRFITIDDAVNIAVKQFPGSDLVRVSLPQGQRDPFVVSARYPGDESPFGLSWVNLDQTDGRVLSQQDVRFESPADAAQRIDRAIHTGEIRGPLSRVAAFLVCLAILGEMITGLWMWRRRTRARSRAESKHKNVQLKKPNPHEVTSLQD